MGTSSTPLTDALLRRAGLFVGEGDESTQYGTLKADIRQLERDNARLRKALEPFAEIGAEGYAFSGDVYRAARTALSKTVTA